MFRGPETQRTNFFALVQEHTLTYGNTHTPILISMNQDKKKKNIPTQMIHIFVCTLPLNSFIFLYVYEKLPKKQQHCNH